MIEIFISSGALLISIFSLWYVRFRKGKLKAVCSKWTVIGAIGQQNFQKYNAATFAVQIGFINDGPKARVLNDLMLKIETEQGKEYYYRPHMLFDVTTLYGSMGEDKVMAKVQKGLVPIPTIIEGNSYFQFDYEVYFWPHDFVPMDAQKETPCDLKAYALYDDQDNYQLIGKQYVKKEEVKNIKNGTFSALESTKSKEKRDEFIRHT